MQVGCWIGKKGDYLCHKMGQHIEAMPSSLTIRYAIKTKKAAENQLLFAYRVELEGIEPSSAQGNHTLSTCLFQPSIFEVWQDLDHQSQPYPLKLHLSIEAYTDYFRFTCTAWPSDSEQHPWSDVSFRQPCGGIKLIYCTSIKQRERSCFRQLNCWSLRLRS